MKGFIRQRGDAWELRVYLGADPVTGKQRDATRTVRAGKREAQRVPHEMITEAERCLAVRRNATVGPLGDSAMSNTKLVIDITNSSGRPCTLPETPPTLAGVNADGSRVPLVAQSNKTFFGSPGHRRRASGQ